MSVKDSGGGNTVCHLKTDKVLLGTWSSGGSTGHAASEAPESSSKAKEAGRGGRGSGELAGDSGSKSKEEHSGSGSNESDLRAHGSEGSVEDSVGICGEFRAGNTVFKRGNKVEEESEVEHVRRAAGDDPKVQN